MALGSEVSDNKQQNGGNNEVKHVKTENKSVDQNAPETLKKNKKLSKNIKSSPASVNNGGNNNKQISNSSENKKTASLTNGHSSIDREAKDERETAKSDGGEVQQNGGEVQRNGHESNKSNGHVAAARGGGEETTCPYGGKQPDSLSSSSPSCAAAAAKSPANATSKPLSKVDTSRTSSATSSAASSPEVINSSSENNKSLNSSNLSSNSKGNHKNANNQKNGAVKSEKNNKVESKEGANQTVSQNHKDASAKCQTAVSNNSTVDGAAQRNQLPTKVTNDLSENKCDKNSTPKLDTSSDNKSVTKIVNSPDSVTKAVHEKADVSDADSGIALSSVETLSNSDGAGTAQSESLGDEEMDDKKGDQEVLFIQDVGFTVKIVSPGAQPFDIQVSSMELVQEIHQLLMDREDTCHRTCFSLQLDGNTLDNFAEVKNIEGLREGSVIKVVEEPYTVREARIHVRHVRDLLKSLDSSDAYTGTECSSLAFLNVVTQGDILEKKKTRPESVDCTPPDYIMPGSKERPLMPLHPITKESKGPQCIKVLTTSAWNPPPGPRKMNGDLLYLYVVTVEDKHFHITACSRGFYLNQSSEENFNPKASTPSNLSHSLTDLLSSISPTFKRNFSIVQRRRTQKHPFERVATPYQLYSWTAPVIDHTVDAIRAEDNFSSKLGYEEHIPGQTRDWNEELQTTRELPRKTLPERLLRERAIFKVHSDFVAAATRGAMAVVDGNVMAINPGEEAKMQMFIWNNIFFSLGFDVRDHYKELGGDAAAFIAPRNDLQGVRVYSAVDLEGLYTLGTVVIDYRGFRVTAQSIIPGILEKEQEQSVIYGSIDFGKTVLTHPKYMDLLSKAGKQLKIFPHSVVSVKGESVELCSSVECKGIVGNDGRHYILDLLRTFPPDVNFLKLSDVELREDVKALGYPIEHKHKLCCLRQELVDSFVEARYLMFTHYIQCHFLELGMKKQNKEGGGEELKAIEDGTTENNNVVIEKDSKENEKESDNNKTNDSAVVNKSSNKKKNHKKDDVESVAKPAEKKSEIENDKLEQDNKKKDEKTIEEVMAAVSAAGKEENEEDVAAKRIVESLIDSFSKGEKEHMPANIVKAACKSVGSLKESEFDIRFNPDVYSDGIQHDCTDEELEKQRHLVKEAAAFLVTTQIPTFIRECMDHTSAPMDGSTLADALHTRGINIRYLGRVCDLLALIKPLSYLYSIAVSEILLRSAKHIFTTYVQACELMSLSQAISHFLNCLLSSSTSVSPPGPVSPDDPRTNNRRRGRRKNNTSNKVQHWTTLTPKSLWSQIKQELKSYWNWTLSTDSMDSTVETYNLQKISLLRSFCIKVGLQILLREYDFDSKHKVTFNSSDIMNIFPVVKHINPRASDAYNFYTTGQNKIQAGQVKDGHELITEALNLLNNVYGAMHPEIAQCLRMVARLCYVTGDHKEAMAYQQKAVLMSERVNGIDHPYTITEYTHLALYCFANGQVSSALKLLYRARYLALLVCGENHPEIALLDSNISLILHAVGEYELSLRFLERAAALTAQCHGTRSLKAAAARHLLARTLSCLGDFRAALIHERETYSIYKQQLGENHEKTRESSDCLRHLTHQAVVLQKKMNDICSGRAVGAPPIHIQPPSMGSVLDMLNVINGILFVQISQQDIEQLKAEIEKRQLKEESPEKAAPEENGSSSSSNNNSKIQIQIDKNVMKISC